MYIEGSNTGNNIFELPSGLPNRSYPMDRVDGSASNLPDAVYSFLVSETDKFSPRVLRQSLSNAQNKTSPKA